MGEVIPFDFDTHAVRVVTIDDEAWFVAADVCRVLDHSNVTKALSRLDDDEKRVIDPNLQLGSSQEYPNQRLGYWPRGRGNPNVNIISESGLYALILTSKKPEAKRFRKWVTSEVLPAIRRDGSYSLTARERETFATKRQFYLLLPEAQRESADLKARCLERVEDLIADGYGASAAVALTAQEAGVSVRSVWYWRRTVYMVAKADWAPAVAPKWRAPKGPVADCHPEALRLFLDLALRGGRISDCYRRMTEEAARRGWSPIPSERTLRRRVAGVLPKGRAS